MKRAIATILAAGAALAACGASEQAEAEGASKDAATSSAPADVSDGLISCAIPDYDGTQGMTLTQSFILTDGQVKRYSDFQNVAFDLCEAGQEGCSMGIEDGTIKMEYTSPSGAKSRYHVDLGTMQIEAWEAKPGEKERAIAIAEDTRCTRAPLPEGLTIN